ncbi:MAG TPA: hypothetical protein VH142_27625 [Polyangiaceae bacterium]|jgi:hypothetical protein|nr:hypothetical protein [Polyangiaceae bacterium]
MSVFETSSRCGLSVALALALCLGAAGCTKNSCLRHSDCSSSERCYSGQCVPRITPPDGAAPVSAGGTGGSGGTGGTGGTSASGGTGGVVATGGSSPVTDAGVVDAGHD